MRYMRSSVWRLIYISSFIVVVLNTIAIWNYVNQKEGAARDRDVDSLIKSIYNEKKRDDTLTIKKSKHVLFDSKLFYNREYLVDNIVGTNARLDVHFRSRTLLNSSSLDNYPKDVFTTKQKKQGYITFHVLGVCYMFLGLAIICDDFFVPALHIISKMLNISDDVAGATFMAAGGSAPELFVSIIGVFISKSNVGFGTIVGSAVFNVLFVIGMCAMFSKAILSLTWWPLLRDSIFYIISLVVLIIFFNNQRIEWWEALILLLIYVSYVVFMYFNSKTERVVKNFLATNTRCFSSVTPMQLKTTAITSPSDLKKDVYANGAVQLAIHTLDPIAEDSVDEKFRRMRQHSTATPVSNIIFGSEQFDGQCDCGRCSTCSSIIGVSSPRSPILAKTAHNSIKDSQTSAEKVNTTEEETQFQEEVKIEVTPHSTPPPPYRNDNLVYNINDVEEANSDCCQNNGTSISKKTIDMSPSPYSAGDIDLNDLQESNENEKDINKNCATGNNNTAGRSLHNCRQFSRQSGRNSARSRGSCHSHRGLFIPAPNNDEPDSEEIEGPVEEEEEEEPIDFSFPPDCGARVYYIIKLPLIMAFSLTVPDVRRQKLWKLFPVTFVMSIVWIAILSYLMAWWATEIGIVAGIPEEVMGLTFLAAGTSIPDLITSVVVARQGHGDMAVSSSIGSNIFDVTVGLPFPWLLKSLINYRKPVNVESDGLFCSTILLFLMLLAIVITIALNKWKMTRLLGAIMFGLYVVFITITLLLQFKVFSCPLN